MARLTGTDADELLNGPDENLAIAYLAGTRRPDYGIDNSFCLGGGNYYINLDFWQKINHIFGATIKLGMPFLAPETLDLGDGQAADTSLGKGFAHLVKLEGFDYGCDLLHVGLRHQGILKNH